MDLIKYFTFSCYKNSPGCVIFDSFPLSSMAIFLICSYDIDQSRPLFCICKSRDLRFILGSDCTAAVLSCLRQTSQTDL